VNSSYSNYNLDLFVGRERELKSFRELFNLALENKGSFVLIEGETGIGKTRLTEEFLKSIKSQEVTVIRGHGYHKEISPYRLFSEIFRNYFSSVNYDTRYLALLLDNLTIVNLEKIVPELREFIPFDTSRIAPSPLPPKEEKQRFYDTLLLFFLKLSQRLPLILNIEDLHWLEPDTFELLRYLIHNFRKSPILVIATARGLEPGSFAENWVSGLEDQRLVHRIKLSALLPEEIRSLVEAFFNEKLSNRFLKWLTDYTAGNPLFVHETLRSGMEQNAFLFDPVESFWEIKKEYLENIFEPATIGSVIQRRLQGLDPTSHEVLCLAAVVGYKFELLTLQKISDFSLACLRASLVDLISRNLLQRQSKKDKEEGVYRFIHHVLRLHIYQGLDPDFKLKMHHRIASILEKECGRSKHKLFQKVEDLANHYSHGKKDRISLNKTVNFLTQAGLKAQKQYSEGKAEEYYNQAIELLESLPSSKEKDRKLLGLLENLGDVETALGKQDMAISSYQKALQIGKTHNLLSRLKEAQIYRKIGYAYHLLSDYPQAISHYHKALNRLKQISTDDEYMEFITTCNRLGMTHFFKGDYQECLQWAEKGIGLSKKKKHLPLIELSYNNMGMVACSRGEYGRAIEIFNKCLDIQLKVQDKYRLSYIYTNLGVINVNLGLYDKASDYYYKALSLAEETGNICLKGILYNNLGVLCNDKGEWEEALGFFEKSLKIREQYGDRRGMVSALENLGAASLSQKQVEKALTYLDKSVKLCQEIGAKEVLPFVQVRLGEAYFKLNDFENAKRYFESALEISTKQSSKLAMGTAKRSLARFHSGLKFWEKAESLFEESKEIFEDLKSTFELAQTLSNWGLCLAQKARELESQRKKEQIQESEKMYREAIEILVDLGFEKRLKLLVEEIRENRLELELEQVLKEITQKLKEMEVKKRVEEYPESEALVGVTGDYMDHLRIYCFGRLRVYRPYESEEIPAKEWGSAKPKQILANLVVNDPKKMGVTRDKLVDAIWPEIDPKNLGNTFHVTLSHLRKALEKDKSEYITSQGGVYRLNWEGKVWSDVHEFLSHVEKALHFEKEEKFHLSDFEYQKAAELYSSNLLEDFYDNWAEAARDEYREKYRTVFWKLSHLALQKFDYQKCIRYTQSLLLSDPTDEEAHRLIMLSYALLGSRTAAVRQYKACQENLRRYLDIEPEPETVSLCKKIKQGDLKGSKSLFESRLRLPT
jgi:predicted ATPase/DNA-binding SARP family transcriptional activator